MRINVIIPVYNAEKYLQKAVDSVLCQPFPRLRVILVDDGSNDNSSVLCDQLAERFDQVVALHQANCGVSVARNTGIEYILNNDCSESDYIAFLDADDFWYPEVFTEELSKHIEESLADIYAFGATACTQNEKRFSRPYLYAAEITTGGQNTVWKLQNTFAANLYNAFLGKKVVHSIFTRL